jgi:hypothetical protein
LLNDARICWRAESVPDVADRSQFRPRESERESAHTHRSLNSPFGHKLLPHLNMWVKTERPCKGSRSRSRQSASPSAPRCTAASGRWAVDARRPTPGSAGPSSAAGTVPPVGGTSASPARDPSRSLHPVPRCSVSKTLAARLAACGTWMPKWPVSQITSWFRRIRMPPCQDRGPLSIPSLTISCKKQEGHALRGDQFDEGRLSPVVLSSTNAIKMATCDNSLF